MAIIIDKKLVFYHYPRTSGVWFYHVLKHGRIPHINLNDYHYGFKRIMDSEEYKSYAHELTCLPSFFVIRDPVEWYPSYWNRRNDRGWENSSACWWYEFDMHCRSDDFETFLDKAKEWNKTHKSIMETLYEEYQTAPNLEVIKFGYFKNYICRIFTEMNLCGNLIAIKDMAKLNCSPINITIDENMKKKINDLEPAFIRIGALK